MNVEQIRKKYVQYLIFISVGTVVFYILSVLQWRGFSFIAGLCGIVGMMFVLLTSFQYSKVLKIVMYSLVASTFLNQALFSIHVGFFSLFLYRLLLLIAISISIVVVRKDIYSFQQLTVPSPVKYMLIFLIFWIGYGAISLLWVKSLTYGVKYIFLLVLGIAFVFLAVFTFTRMKDLINFYRIWMISTVLLMIIGFINHFAHIQLKTSTLYGASAYRLSYPTAVFFNQNDFATFLTISFFFFLSVAKNKSKILIRITMLLLSVCALLLIHYTESRASSIGVIAGGLFYLFLIIPSKYKKPVSLSSLGFMAFVAVLSLQKIYDKCMSLFASSELHDSATSLSSNIVRVNLLKSTWHDLLNSGGFGVGAGNMPFYLQYKSIFDTNHVTEVHNWLMEIAGNFGFGIMFGYIVMYVTIFIYLYRTYKHQKLSEDRLLLEGLMTAQIGFIISSISPSSMSNLYFHWVFIGLLIATVSVYTKQRKTAWYLIKRGEIYGEI